MTEGCLPWAQTLGTILTYVVVFIEFSVQAEC